MLSRGGDVSLHAGNGTCAGGTLLAISATGLICVRGGTVLHVLALTHTAVTIRHWFEVDLDDASMEHGARIEVR
jgi:hypothetical protein